MDTLLYDMSIPAISWLQTTMSQQADFMQLMSTVFDPKYAFLVYSPLVYLLDARVGKRLIMTVVLAEWLNQLLKWFLHGERPYWYVHSSGHFDARLTPIKQFPISCELGPGHPSGHAMVTASVWFIILSACHEAYANYQQQGKSTTSSTLTTWFAYAALLTLVSVSRVFLGCHFPHQCLAGAALGLLLARWLSVQHIRPHHYVTASAFLFVSAFATFGLLQALGLDPNWTIKLATKHCVKRDYIHLDTAPFFSIMRYCGFALGSGLGLMFPVKSYLRLVEPEVGHTLVNSEDVKGSRFSSRQLTWLSFKLLMALLMARLVDNLALFVSHSNLTLFYSCAFVAYTSFSYAFINLH